MASPSEEPVSRKKTPESEGNMYRTKIIKFLGRITPIITQDFNGPCPLIAVCNILLLRNKLDLSADIEKVSQKRLCKLVTESLTKNNKAEASVNNQAQRIAEAIRMVPSLANPLDVNLRFKRIDELEMTTERAVFDLLDIPLYHGWIVDPQDSDTCNAFGSKCYNTVIAELSDLNSDALKLVVTANQNSDVDHGGPNIRDSDEWVTSETDPGSSVEADKASHGGQVNTSESSKHERKCGITVEQGDLIRKFLLSNTTQLTQYGLNRLQIDLKESELCVLFRNNHFNTMFKFEGELYALVTDQGYINSPDLVWEKLNEVDGDTWWADEDFRSKRKSKRKTNYFDRLHDDLHVEIFDKTPEDVLRYQTRFTCTRWFKIITNSILFEDESVIVEGKYPGSYSLVYLIAGGENGVKKLTRSKLQIPVDGYIVGWSKQLLLISSRKKKCKLYIFDLIKKIGVWLPSCSTKCDESCTVALAYDEEMDNFKVIHVFGIGIHVLCESLFFESGTTTATLLKWNNTSQFEPGLIGYNWADQILIGGRFLFWKKMIIHHEETTTILSMDVIKGQFRWTNIVGGKQEFFLFEMGKQLHLFEKVKFNRIEISCLCDYEKQMWKSGAHQIIISREFGTSIFRSECLVPVITVGSRYIFMKTRSSCIYVYDMKHCKMKWIGHGIVKKGETLCLTSTRICFGE